MCGTGTSRGTSRRSIPVVVPWKWYGNGASRPIELSRGVTPAPYARASAAAMSTALDVICPRAQVVGREVHVHRVRAVERVDAARKMAAELEREVERHAAGDVRRPIGPV